MDDKLTPQEARDVVARRIVDSARKNGQAVKFEDAQARVATAMARGDQKRSNQNR